MGFVEWSAYKCFQDIFSCDMHITIHVSGIKENDTKSSVLKTARRGKRHQGFKSDPA